MGCFRISIFISPIFFGTICGNRDQGGGGNGHLFFFGFQSYQRWKNNLIGIEPQFLYMTFSILILNRHIVMEKHDLTPFCFPVSPSFFFCWIIQFGFYRALLSVLEVFSIHLYLLQWIRFLQATRCNFVHVSRPDLCRV